MSTLSASLRSKAAEIINSSFEAIGISSTLNAQSILENVIHGFIILAPVVSPFDTLLDRFAKNRRGEKRLFYRFYPPDIAEQILSGSRLQISHLAAQRDDKEFTQFFEESGMWTASNGFRYLPQDEAGKPIKCQSPEQIREWVYGLCFTKNLGNPRFWKEFAGNGSGVCFIIEVIDTCTDIAHRPFYYLRDVGYTNGQEFLFLQSLQDRLLAHIGLPLNFHRVPILAAYTKRNPMLWEDEVRLVIDYKYILEGYHENPDYHFTCADVDPRGAKERLYLNMPIIRLPFSPEPHFKLRLRGLVWGPQSSDLQRKIGRRVQASLPDLFVTSNEQEALEFERGYDFPADSVESLDTLELLGSTVNGELLTSDQFGSILNSDLD